MLYRYPTCVEGGLDARVHASLYLPDLCAHANSDGVSFPLAWGSKTAEHSHPAAASSSNLRDLGCRSDRTHRRNVGHDRAVYRMGGISLQRAHGIRLLDGPWHTGASPYSEHGRAGRSVLFRLLVYFSARLRHLERRRCAKASFWRLTSREIGSGESAGSSTVGDCWIHHEFHIIELKSSTLECKHQIPYRVEPDEGDGWSSLSHVKAASKSRKAFS